eukprot:350178-Chlamydomonas_euryale.AAC.5
MPLGEVQWHSPGNGNNPGTHTKWGKDLTPNHLTQSIPMMLGDQQTVTRQHSTMKCVEVKSLAPDDGSMLRSVPMTSASKRHRRSGCTVMRCAINRTGFIPCSPTANKNAGGLQRIVPRNTSAVCSLRHRVAKSTPLQEE